MDITDLDTTVHKGKVVISKQSKYKPAHLRSQGTKDKLNKKKKYGNPVVAKPILNP